MKKRSNRLWDSCTRTLGLETKPEKRWFIAAFILLFGYLWLCQCMRFFLSCEVSSGIACTILMPAVQVLPVCVFGIMLFAKFRIPASADGFPRLRRFFPAMVSALTFGYLLLWLMAYYPGGFSPDSLNQLEQVITGSYNNWHPVLHTWVFFWIPWQIFHHPAGITLYQILLFSLAVGYLYRVLCRRGCPMWFLIGSWLFLILNAQTARIMMFPWKDSALSIAALVIFTQIIEIYETDGAWLRKWHHFLSFTALCFLATVFRHNAILLTAPIYGIMLLFQKKERKTVLLSGLLVLLALWLLNGPVMALSNVESPTARQEEVLGLPMTMLAEVFIHTPEKLSAKAYDFLSCLATTEEWFGYYQTGDFNSIKMNSSLPLVDLIENEGVKTVLRYTLEATLASPIPALRGFITLTQMVWNPSTPFGLYYNPLPYCMDNSLGVIMGQSTALTQALTCFSDTAESLFLYLFTQNIGMIILIALFAAVTNVGRGKLSRAFMIFPMLIYDFGTMLLLTGPDFRFFHFNFVIIIPLLYLILSGRKNNEPVT